MHHVARATLVIVPRGFRRRAATAVAVAWLVLLSACASHPLLLPGPATAYGAADNHDVFARYAPIIVPQDPRQSFNRIGQATVRIDGRGNERADVDPTQPVYYVQQRAFTTPRGQYVNLIYRVHFERVPYSLVPFHLTAGDNGGLLVIVTLNESKQPLLITTVHTCGCYLAFVPTGYLDADAYPDDWPRYTQQVYGEELPARLDYALPFTPDQRVVVYLRSGTHRVMDIRVVPQQQADAAFRIVPATLAPVESLKQLPVRGGSASFYETSGPRRGYVRDTYKPLEFLLMSWWALDPRIGVDKDLGNTDEAGPVFYTSLKPWRRRASDMREFAGFLDYWGWRL